MFAPAYGRIPERQAQFVWFHESGALTEDGERIVLAKGDVGYIRARRIHDARYIEDCQLVYVHNGAFEFLLAPAETG